jgi:hypothetical protein
MAWLKTLVLQEKNKTAHLRNDKRHRKRPQTAQQGTRKTLVLQEKIKQTT